MTYETRTHPRHGDHCTHGPSTRVRRFGAGTGPLLGLTAFALTVAVVAGPARPQHPDVASAARTGAPGTASTVSYPVVASDPALPSSPGNPVAAAATVGAARTKAATGHGRQQAVAAPKPAAQPAAPRAKTPAPKPAAKPKVTAAARNAAPKRVAAAAVAAKPRKRVVRVGNDVSWPQCGKYGLRMPKKSRHFVVVGLTGGRAFRPNPCVNAQVAWAKKHKFYTGAYAMTTFPTKAQYRKHGHKGPYSGKSYYSRLGNTGAAAARFDIATMKRAGLGTKHIWIDIEPHPSRRWTRNRAANKAVIDGLVRGYRKAGYTVGFYSTKALWHHIVGPAKYHAYEWRTAGPTSPKKAAGMCKRGSIQGGKAVIAQWWTSKADHNLTCGWVGRDEVMRRFFIKY